MCRCVHTLEEEWEESAQSILKDDLSCSDSHSGFIIILFFLQFFLSWFETVGCVVSANLGDTNDMNGKSK